MSMTPETPMGKCRSKEGYTALKLARTLRVQLPTMTEQRLYRIETGRCKATPEEREAIGRLLNARPWELNI